MQRLRFLVWKEFLELRQNPRLFGVVIVAPIIQLTMLGYAATTDVKDVPVVVADGDRSPASRELIARFDASRNFTVIDTVTTVSRDRAVSRARTGVAGAVDSARATARDLAAGKPVTLQVVADGTRFELDDRRAGYATALVGDYAQELIADGSRPVPAARVSTPGFASGSTRSSRAGIFMIPGVLALLLLVVTANLAAMAIVREKELGTLEQLNVTPLRRWELIVGKLLPYGVIALIDVLLVMAVAVFWFEVPLRGSFSLLLAMSLLYVLCTLALGLFISTISDTQQQAMMTATFFFLTPMIYLSGFIFPIENMPPCHSGGHLPDSAALLPGHRAGHLPQGDRPGAVVAAGGGARIVGYGGADAGGCSQHEARVMTVVVGRGLQTPPGRA